MAAAESPPGSLWWVDESPCFPVLEADLDVDVLVIGGGIAGLTLAWTLVERDCLVGLLDAGPLAGGASGHSAGLLTVAPAEPYPELVALWGRDAARAVLEAGRRSHRRVRELAEALGIECDYRSRGSLRLACSAEEASDFRASLDPLRADGFPMEEWPLERAVPGPAAAGFTGAFHTAEDGELHPVRFLRGLARAALGRGARLFERSALASAAWRGGLWEARVLAGTGAAGCVVRARTLVIAANAWAPRICPGLAELIAPRRGQMLSTAPIGREVSPCPVSARYGYRYWRQTPDGRLAIGGWRDLDFDGEVGYENQPTPAIQAGIEQGLRELVPEGAGIERRWAATMGFARDGRPLVGWLDAAHHLAVCAGFTGHGLSMAPACTLDLAELLEWKRAPALAGFDPRRFASLRDRREGVTALGPGSG